MTMDENSDVNRYIKQSIFEVVSSIVNIMTIV